MSLLQEIQASLLQSESDIGPILLKLRFVASRLGSTPLEEWVKFESEGYPAGMDVPDYRRVRASYSGSWSNRLIGHVNNAPIPIHLVEKYAGKEWADISIRQSISAIDSLVSGEGDTLMTDASNLILLFQGKIYPDFTCVSVSGEISKTSVIEIQNAVRNRVLELTIELERAIPEVANVQLKGPIDAEDDAAEAVTQVFNQTIYGTNTTLAHGQIGTQINLAIEQGDKISLVRELVKAGLPEVSAREFAEILESEHPETPGVPFGRRAAKWLSNNVGKAADGTWKIGLGVAMRVLEEAAMRYYNLK